MLGIESVNHVGIRVREKERSVTFYELLGFKFDSDAGFEQGHPIIMHHPGGVTINLLGPASNSTDNNILMDVEEKHSGITHVALTVSSLDDTKSFFAENNIELTGSFSFGKMSAVFIRDPDRNVIELDAYGDDQPDDLDGYSGHL
jgi:lactoylglutathione lyase